MRRLAAITVVLLAAAAWATSAAAEIRIGVAGPMTGPIAWFGEQYLRATELALDDLNANGGVLGQKVELIVGDDFCDPEQAVAAAHKLASDGVVFVVGHFCSRARSTSTRSSRAMHSRPFDTVLGTIGFDEKGDVTGFEPWQWFVWQADGTYVPLEQDTPKR
jgi:ABC-type branched-subunit amino acid transport system substrate-binding protein